MPDQAQISVHFLVQNAPAVGGAKGARYYEALGVPQPLTPSAAACFEVEVEPSVAPGHVLEVVWRTSGGENLSPFRLKLEGEAQGFTIPAAKLSLGVHLAFWRLKSPSNEVLAQGKTPFVVEEAAPVVDLWGCYRFDCGGFFVDVDAATGTLSALCTQSAPTACYWPLPPAPASRLGQVEVRYRSLQHKGETTSESTWRSDDTRLAALSEGLVKVTYSEQSSIAGGLNLVGLTERYWQEEGGLCWELELSGRARQKLMVEEVLLQTPFPATGARAPILALHRDSSYALVPPLEAERPFLLLACAHGALTGAKSTGERLLLRAFALPEEPLTLKTNAQARLALRLQLVDSLEEALLVVEGLGQVALPPGPLHLAAGRESTLPVRASNTTLKKLYLGKRKLKLQAKTGVFEQPLPALAPGEYELRFEYDKRRTATLQLVVEAGEA